MRPEELDDLYPGLAEELSKPGELAPEEIIVERLGTGVEGSVNPVMLVRGMHVHSPRDPVREAQRLASAALENAVLPKEAPIIIMGFGLGYAAEAAAELAPGRPLIIVERHPEILRIALESRKLEKFLSENRLVFVLGEDPNGARSALSLFEKSIGGNFPPCIKNRALVNLDAGWYAAVENNIKTWLSRNEVNKATLKRFGRRWMRNLSRNLPAIRDTPGISRLRGILKNEKGLPVFLAAAGPGLDTVSSILPEIKQRCVTVAVDTSLRFFLSRGVDPDFVISVDPQYWNFRHLDRLPAPRTRLIAESAVYPPCLRHPFRGTLLGSSLFPAGRFIEERVDPKGELGAGGSVATSAWDFARILGAAAIWIAGLDLSFPQLKTHFRGALFEDRSLSELDRFVPGETMTFRALRDGQPFPMANAQGGTVITDKRLSLYASWFENRFRLYPEIRNISLSGEGLAIPGLEIVSPDALLALPERRYEIDVLLKETFSGIEADFSAESTCNERSVKYDKALEALTGGLERVRQLAKDAAETAENAARQSKRGNLPPNEQERALKNLDSALVCLNSSEVKETAGFLFPDMSETLEETSNRGSFANHMEFSTRFYRALEESAGYNLELFGMTRE